MPTRPSLLLALLSVAAPATAQRTIAVPDDFASIQGAIEAAVDGDTVLVAPGVYVEQLDFLGKAITVRSAGGADVTTVDSEGGDAWPDFPYGPVVRMIRGEGRSSVLAGFTITGGLSTVGIGPAGYSGVWCAGLSPTIRDCVIIGNSGGIGGGVTGDALLERCTIADNDTMPYGEGGGVHGAPTIVDCVITGNRSGGLGGGVYATGPCTITGTVIDLNVAGNGADGYSGGGVFGPATLIDCQITRNLAHHYFSGGPPDEIGTGVDGAVSLSGCTVADNKIVGGPVVGEMSGGIRNVDTVTDCIVWNNQGNQIAVSSTPTVRYSIVMDGYAGEGNLALDPRFRDAANADYFLEPTSPAIDAGDPVGKHDPDGTESDMGAYYFPQFAASFAPRNGSGANPLCYDAVLRPVIGTSWIATVDATAHGFQAASVVLLGYLEDTPPIAFPFGELLVDTSSPLALFSTVPPVGGQSIHVLPVPPDYALGGLVLYTQAVVLGPASIGLCNALDLTLGL